MKQVRFIPIEDCGLQVRSSEDAHSERTVVGVPIISGVRSVNLTPMSDTREVYEVLERGCIDEELLQRSDVILNVNHSTKVTDVLGRMRNGQGTLSLTLRGDGNVEAACELPNTSCGNDTLELIRRGDISGMSFAFVDGAGNVTYENTREVTKEGKEIWLRKVRKITGLYDVAIVTHPAYEQTCVGTREAADAMLRDIDEQIAAETRQRNADKQEDDERRLEEAAERAREMAAFRRRCQRRKLDNFYY